MAAKDEMDLENDLGRILCDAGVWDDPAPTIEIAGDGNINWVRRLRSNVSSRTLIVKHARPALEKFPEYETSTDRIVFENRYYEIARPLDEANVCPRILHFDVERRLLALEDLGDAERLDDALLREADVAAAVDTLLRFLGTVHAATRSDERLAGRFANADIQTLHGDHIFKLPYEGDGFPVPGGVEERAAAVRRSSALREAAARAYERYLEPRGALVHADVQPGNILLAPTGPKLLDAEIAHVGDPAFDVGTLLAHVELARLTAPGSPSMPERTTRAWAAYVRASGTTDTDFEDVARYTGLEMMRRTIGAARVQAVATSDASLAAIEVAERLILESPRTPEEFPSP